MRVLYLDHPEGDFLHAQLYRGFVYLLGADEVVDWPRKKSYHGEQHRYPRPWEASGVEGVTGPFAWFPAVQNREWGLDEICAQIRSFDYLVVSIRRVAVEAFWTLANRLGRGNLPSVALVDGDDADNIRWDLCNTIQPHVYFKRELVRGTPRLGHTRVVPISFSSVAVHKKAPDHAFDHDVCFLGGSNRPGGKGPIEDAVRKVPGNHLMGQVGYDEYVKRVQRSKIVVVPRGHGWDTLRFWETLATEGPMMVSDRLPLERYSPPVDNVHCAYFDDPNHLEAVLRHYLSHEDERARVASAGYDLFLRDHTPRELARYVLKEGGMSV